MPKFFFPQPETISMEVSCVELAALCSISLILVLLFHHNSAKKTVFHDVKSYPIIGILPSFVQNRHRFLEWITGSLVSSPTRTVSFTITGQAGGLITGNPANVEYILKSNFQNYPKGEMSKQMLMDFLGHGLFNTDGEDWKWQRKAASYEFNKRSLRNFVVDVVQHEIADRLLPLLRMSAAKDAAIDLQDVLERFGFDNICRVAFNEDPACLDAEEIIDGKAAPSSSFMQAFGKAQNLILNYRLMHPLKFTWKIKKLLNIGSERQLKQAMSVVHDYAAKIIKARKEKDLEGYHDLLSRFAMNPDTSEELLRDIVISFLLAGKETTSSAMAWFFWILSTRPDVEKKIEEEIRTIRSSSKNSCETFSYDELRDMHYLHAAVSESVRLYPPVPLDTQSCLKDDTLPDGTFVGKDWFVSYSAYAMGRLEDIWGKDCNEYRPERWLKNGVFQPESPFRFPVFHAGPRMCLGKEMAYIQMKSVAACVIERFTINVLSKEKTPDYHLSLTLRIKGGLSIKVKEKAHRIL